MIGYVETKGYKVNRLPYLEVEKNKISGNLAHSEWLGVDWQTDAVETKSIIEKDGYTDWLIVDNYALDRHWEEQMRSIAKKIMVIDDLADRPHDCDLILDQNLYEDINNRYNKLVPASCKKLLGPKYALLRKEFIEARKNLRERDGKVKNILIFFGGVDPTNETLKALEAIQMLNRPDIAIEVVVGAANPNKDKIRDICSTLPNAHYHCQVDSMANLMAKADLAIGAGGSTMWERCYLGLPSIIVAIADNQVEIAKTVAAEGAIRNLGLSNVVNVGSLLKAVSDIIENPTVLKDMGSIALDLVNKDESNAIVTEILETNFVCLEEFRLRPITEGDLKKVLEWRNSQRVRANMYTDHIITVEEHRAWFAGLKEREDVIYLVFESKDRPLGMVYFTEIDKKKDNAIFGFYLGETNLPRGTGAIMGILGLRYAFRELGLRKLCSETFAFNQPAVNFLKRLGFSEEGSFKRHMKNDNYEDIFSFVIFRKTWKGNEPCLIESTLSHIKGRS